MSNLAISHIGSNFIIHFLVNCRKKEKLFIGDPDGPTKKLQLKFEKYNLVWTEDEVGFEIVDGMPVFNKTIDQLVSCENFEIEEISHNHEIEALKKLKAISNYSYPQIDTFVDSNEASVVLKVYGKVLLGLCKIVYKLLK